MLPNLHIPSIDEALLPVNLIAPNSREGRRREKLAHARTRDIGANGTAMCGRYRFADIGIRPSGAPPRHAHLKRARSPRLRDGLCRPSPHRRRVRVPSRIAARQQPAGAKQALEALLQLRRPTHRRQTSHAPTQPLARRRQTIPPVSAHTSKPSLQAHAPTSEAPRNRAIQSARTPKQIRNLLSRRASSKRFPATITASSSQAFTCAETDTIEPACIGQGRCPRDARSRNRGARQAWARRERQRERIRLKRLIQHGTPYSHRLLSRKRRPR